MNRLSKDSQARIVAALVEGNTVRGTAKILGMSKRTVLRNLVWIGNACQAFHNRTVRGLKCTHIQADETWSYVWAKDKNLPNELQKSLEHGEMWTWIAKCPHTRLVIAWRVGKHTFKDCQLFLNDIASRVPGRVQLTTDQLRHYRAAM